MANIDRRTFTRYQVHIGAKVITPQSSFGAEMVEISVVGLRIHSLQAINPGTKVTLCIELDEKISFYGKVVWVLGSLTEHIQYYIIGIETEAMELSDTQAKGLTKRTELLQEILYNIKEQAVSAII